MLSRLRRGLLTSVAAMGGFSPLSLFAASEPGFWYDPSDLSTLFQDAAGTTPVTAAGQSVGLVLDKSGRGNHATQSTSLSRPTYQVDSNGRGYLNFDGSDDSLVTGTITPGTDKAQVFAGVRKPVENANGTIVEFSVAADGNPGAFFLRASGGSSANYQWAVRSASNTTSPVITATAPDTSVLDLLVDFAAPITTTRRNGAQTTFAATPAGAGNFLAYPAYIGRRGGTSLPFNGRIYSLICRFGPNLTADQIAQTEAWVNARTGAY